MEKGFDRIGTDSDPGISRDYKNNPTMLEIIQNKHSSDIREDLQESINYIAGKMPKEMRIPFRAGSLKVFKDGHKFLVGSNKDKRMVLCDDDKIIKDLNPGGAVTAIELGDNDEYAYIACDLLIKQISLKTFETVKTYKGHYDKITALVRSPDDKMLYSCSHDYSVRKNVIGDFSDGESHILHVHDWKVISIDISKDGLHLISGGSNYEIKIYSILEDSSISVESQQRSVSSVKFSPKKTYFATTDYTYAAYIWRFDTKEIIKTLTGHSDRIRSIKFSLDETMLITASKDTIIRIWSLNTSHDPIAMKGHSASVRAVSISASENLIFSLGKDYKLLTWKFPQFDDSFSLVDHTATIYKILISNKRKLIYSNSDDKKIIVWDQFTGNKLKELVHDASMFAMTMSSDENSLYSCTDDQKITVWNIETYEIIHVITLNEGKIRAILLTPDDKYLIAGDEAFRITIWNSNDFSLKTVIRSHRESIWSFALLGHDILFSGDQDGVILRHNLTTFKLEDELEGEKSCIQSLCISRDNEFLISGYSSGLMWVWSIKNRNCLREIRYHKDKLTDLYCSLDGQHFFATSEDQKMSIFDLHNLGLVTAIKLKSKIKSLAFTSDESTIVFAVENDLKCIKNPLKVSEVRIFGPEFEKFKFMKYITDIMLSNTPLHDEEMDLYIIEPFHINALHFYAYFNLSEHLKKGIRLGDAFYPSKRDETPLSICLKKSYTESISAIFDTVEKMSNRNMYSFYYFENSLVTLNHRGFPGLETFYNRIFVRFDKGLPKFCDSKSHFPYTVHSDFLIPKVENFTDKISFSNEGQDVMFMNSLVRFDLQMGSKESLQFLDSLWKSPNKDILKTRVIRAILNEKWAKLKWIFHLQTFVFVVYMVALSVYATTVEGHRYWVLLPFGLNSILAAYEFFQMAVGEVYYWQNFWNYNDLFRICLFISYVSMLWTDTKFYNHFLLGAIISMTYFRGTLYFNVFSKTRYIVNLLFEVFGDMIPFLTIFAFSTVSFCIIINAFAGENDQRSFFSWLTMAWSLNVGTYALEWYDSLLMWACHLIFTVFNSTIMLNLLISLMGDSFNRVNENTAIADAIELIHMVLEAETLLFWRRKSGKKEFIQICSAVEELNTIDTLEMKKLENLRKEIGNFEDTINKNHKGVMTRLEETYALAVMWKNKKNAHR